MKGEAQSITDFVPPAPSQVSGVNYITATNPQQILSSWNMRLESILRGVAAIYEYVLLKGIEPVKAGDNYTGKPTKNRLREHFHWLGQVL